MRNIRIYLYLYIYCYSLKLYYSYKLITMTYSNKFIYQSSCG